MAKKFDVNCLTKNEISVTENPNNNRFVYVVFDDGRKIKLDNKKSSVMNKTKWEDEEVVKKPPLVFFGGEYSRGNPLLAYNKITYMEEIDKEIDNIITYYCE